MKPCRPSARALLIVAALAGMSSSAAASTLPAASDAVKRPLRWSDIVAAVDRDPRLAAAQASSEAGRGELLQASTIPNPQLELGAGRGSARDGSTSDLEWAAELSVPLDWLVSRAPARDAAAAEVDARTAHAEVVRREALVELRTLFLNVAHDQARLEILERLEAETAELARLARLRVERGEARPIEAPRVETELERVRIDVSGARAQLAAHRGQLALWLKNPTSALRVEDPLDPPPAPAAVEALLDELRRHPRLASSVAQLKASSARLRQERRARVPAVSLRGFAERELDRQAFGAGLSIELPVLDWNRGSIERAAAEERAARHSLDAENRSLAASVIEIHAACDLGRETGARWRDEILPRAERAATTLEKSFQAGESALLDVIDARRVVVEAHRESLAARLQAQLDCSRLQLLFGKEIP